MNDKETHGVPRLPFVCLSLDLVKDKLVHQTKHNESSEDGRE